MSAKFDFGAEAALQAAMHRAAMPALYGPVATPEPVICDVTDCGAVAEEGHAYCEEHRACRVCGAIACTSKRCNFSD